MVHFQEAHRHLASIYFAIYLLRIYLSIITASSVCPSDYRKCDALLIATVSNVTPTDHYCSMAGRFISISCHLSLRACRSLSERTVNSLVLITSLDSAVRLSTLNRIKCSGLRLCSPDVCIAILFVGQLV